MIIAYSVAQDGTVQLPAGVRKIAQHGCQAFFADADAKLIEQDTETQAINFFVQRGGFHLGSPDDLPPSRREVYEKNGRRSAVLVKSLE